jgi:two-component system sensor kinase FixL
MGGKTKQILLVEDDEAHVKLIRRAFELHTGSVALDIAATLGEAQAYLAETIPDLVIADLQLPDGSGVELIPDAKENAPFPVVILTGQGKVPVAVAAMRAGALDYVVKSDVALAQIPHSTETALREWGQITLRKRAEQQCRQLVEFAPEAMVIVNNDGEITLINEQAERLFGYGRKELIGKPVEVLLPERFRDKHPALVASYFVERTRRALSSELKVYGRRKDGTEFRIELSLNPIRLESDDVVMAIVHDITERLRAEDEIRQYREGLAHMARLNTMGEMATGIAHELNQPLGALALYASEGQQVLADTALADPEQLRELFKRLTSLANHASAVVGRLRRFIGKRKRIFSSVDVADPIDNVLFLMESDLRRCEVRVEQQLEHAGSKAIMDEIQIQQVLMNLIRNAVDTMCETETVQGTLSITTSRTVDEFIEVAVCDTGKGIPVESADQVFDAFFSSKSEGMGMGLAISRTIIEAHGGRLWMTPNADRGVAFRFTLPIAKEGSSEDDS